MLSTRGLEDVSQQDREEYSHGTKRGILEASCDDGELLDNLPRLHAMSLRAEEFN